MSEIGIEETKDTIEYTVSIILGEFQAVHGAMNTETSVTLKEVFAIIKTAEDKLTDELTSGTF